MSTQSIPQPDIVTQMVRDPDFAKMAVSEQRKALAAHDPVFQNAGDDAIGKFVSAHQPAPPPEKSLSDQAKVDTTTPEYQAWQQKRQAFGQLPFLQKVKAMFTGNAPDVAPPSKGGLPGSFEGHPEHVAEYIPATVGRAAEGAVDIKRGNVAMGLHKELQAVGNAAAPMAPFLAAGAPLAALRIAGGGLAGGTVAKKGAEIAGANSDQAALAGDVGGLAGGGLAAKAPSFLPSTQRAGAVLQNLKQTVGSVPIDTSLPGNSALELYNQSQRGAVLPKAVRQLVNRISDPEAPPLTYAEAKDFQSNISRLSANERMNLNPNTARLVGQLNADLKTSLQNAADTAGQGPQFQQAMKEYASAMRLKGYSEKAIEYGWKTILTGLGLYGAKHILGISLPGEQGHP